MKTTVNDKGETLWHFTRAELTALLAHMSADEARVHQCNLQLDCVNGRAMVTDGHRAAILQTGDRAEHDRALPVFHVVPRSFIEAVHKAAKPKSSITIRVHVNLCAADVDGVSVLPGEPTLNVTPSKVDAVMPRRDDKSRGAVASYNANYLADLALVSAACPPVVRDLPRGKKEKIRSHPVIQFGSGALDPLLATLECPENWCTWRVCIMPVRM